MSLYLVTGAAGFIGSKVCEFLLAGGHTVVGIDNLNNYYDVRLKDHRLGQLLGTDQWRMSDNSGRTMYGADQAMRYKAFSFRRIDIENQQELESLFSEFQFDAIFNLAARAGVRHSLENPHVYMTTNAMGTLNILEGMRRHGVKKMVLASTSSLYAGSPMPFHEDLPVNQPLSPYAASKKAAETMAYSYHHLYGMDVSVVRYFTVYGPASRPDMSPFRFVKWIDEGHPIELFGDGSQSRDFTYVDDIARGTILAEKSTGFEIFNLGSGNKPIRLNTMITLIEQLLGKKARIESKPLSAAEMKETWADISKADRVLGWAPHTLFHDGIRQSVEWYKLNSDWLKNISLRSPIVATIGG